MRSTIDKESLSDTERSLDSTSDGYTSDSENDWGDTSSMFVEDLGIWSALLDIMRNGEHHVRKQGVEETEIHDEGVSLAEQGDEGLMYVDDALETHGDVVMDGACMVVVDAKTCSYGSLSSCDELTIDHAGLPSDDITLKQYPCIWILKRPLMLRLLHALLVWLMRRQQYQSFLLLWKIRVTS
ncbi:hypothetical protein GOP47_0009042 [Adiantum capillus-veneris]|uniref:Uncharacterized protein n=1 Tax=Adiantum capillus-veneris TaxID=13818 RepID=A0A9D4V0Y4_ADICA|nr:hypothetical protein GOP47_0009042 [Adiantum capillus-veneris]